MLMAGSLGKLFGVGLWCEKLQQHQLSLDAGSEDCEAAQRGVAIFELWHAAHFFKLWDQQSEVTEVIVNSDDGDQQFSLSISLATIALLFARPRFQLAAWQRGLAIASAVDDVNAKMLEYAKLDAFIQASFMSIEQAKRSIVSLKNENLDWAPKVLTERFDSLSSSIFSVVLELVRKRCADFVNATQMPVTLPDGKEGTYQDVPKAIESAVEVSEEFLKDTFLKAVTNKIAGQVKTAHLAVNALKKAIAPFNNSMGKCSAVSQMAMKTKHEVAALLDGKDIVEARLAFAYITALSVCLRPLKKSETRAKVVLECPKAVIELISPTMNLILAEFRKVKVETEDEKAKNVD